MIRAPLLSRALAFLIFSIIGSSASGQDSDLYLHVINVESRVPLGGNEFKSPLTVTVHTDRAQKLSDQLALTTAELQTSSNDSLKVAIPHKPVFSAEPTKKDLASSWVIDYEEADVVEVVRHLRDEIGTSPTSEQIANFVARYITNESYIHSFLLASDVARSRAGDCTEHAVLATALARANGMPARVTVGAVVLLSEGKVAVMGHAWSEMHEDGKWKLVDAALIDSTEPVTLFYLPWGHLPSEGPDHNFHTLDILLLKPSLVVVEDLG